MPPQLGFTIVIENVKEPGVPVEVLFQPPYLPFGSFQRAFGDNQSVKLISDIGNNFMPLYQWMETVDTVVGDQVVSVIAPE